jgi:hypothetical protein
MRNVSKVISFNGLVCLFFLSTFSFWNVPAQAAGDCDCPVIECGACKDQVNIEFYTEKCGGGKKVKSCKRPICADKDPLPEMCSASAEPNSKKEKAPEVVKAQKPKAPMKPVGTVISAIGESTITRVDGESKPAKVSLKIFEGDVIETSVNGKVVIKTQNDHTINVVPNSKAVIELFDTNDSTHKTFINLMYGTIRSAVKKAPGNAKNDFKVKTPSAVAGVRGTDFVTTYTDKVGITKVETIHGLVELSSPSGKHSVGVGAGQYASYVVPSGSKTGIGDDDITKYVERGYMTEAMALSPQDLTRIEQDTTFDKEDIKEQKVVAKDAFICSQPSAKLNQCSWTCENNPSGASSCRTDLQQVRCVRKRCNANGTWAEETRLPSNASETCSGSKTVVGPCDY